MITSIFSKSKPVNLIIGCALIIIAFVYHIFFQKDLENLSMAVHGLILFIGLFYMFITDFIVSKNNLTKRHSFAIMMLGLLFLAIPEAFSDVNLLVANLLVLFAMRRLLSLHSKKGLIKKFFDAALWIGLATLFYSWAILYVVVLIVALAYYWQSEVKYIMVSVFGILTVAILLILYNVLCKDQFLLLSNFSMAISFDFSVYNSLSNILKLTIVASVYFWSLVYYLKGISEKNKKMKPSHVLIVIASIVAVIIAVIAPLKNGNEFVFILVPFAIIVANYLETIEEKWFKEVFVALLLLVPILNLIL
ncbi:hypothetical protein DFQ05_1568 [Winogradskyella wandonensis]|uniref:Uncharacterized protein n=1 Tax=Winogradskyella wandonensis TaxID=1442586 RepID=A0A4R1KTA0_9FLAO|nr:DUF6427 family protein [Winogradskyella wandonensis]TCK67787.1 hypothetical protein DFQ05_1568 [Winogradskyella wandonensis]